MIELWETFLLQLDVEEEPGVPSSAYVPPSEPAVHATSEDQVPASAGSDGPVATATDVALEQEA